MNKRFKCLVVFMLCIICGGLIWANSAKIVVQVRLYQGFNEKGDASSVVVTSYYLKKIADGNKMIPLLEMEKEQESLKRVYNLKRVTRVAQMGMTLRKDIPNKLEFPFNLNGRPLLLYVSSQPNKKDRFQVNIKEKDKKKVLMESEIIVPEKKTAVIGFKDSQEKIFFLAFNRKSKGTELEKDLNAKTMQKPKLLYMEEPIYPIDALEHGVSGEVVVTGRTNKEGKVIIVRALDGPKLLRYATLRALKTWRYSPWVINGKPKPVVFSMIFIYAFKGTKIDHNAIHKKYTPLIDANKKKGEVPQILEMILVSGVPVKNAKKYPTGSPQWVLMGSGGIKATNVDPPRLLRRPEPQYPTEALKQGIEGNVVLHCKTDHLGRMATVHVMTGHPLLRDAALASAKRCLYTPWKLDGIPNPVTVDLVYIFRLKKVPAKDIDKLISGEMKNLSKYIFPKKKKKKRRKNKENHLVLSEVILVEGNK